MRDPIVLAQHIADRLIRIDGIAAVVLGGSRALGTSHAASDIDLGLYYDPRQPLDIAGLRALAEEVDDRHESGLITDIGEWGPWINGGGWLIIEGYHVDWLFRDLSRVARVIDECRAGQPICDYQIGHPHGFLSHIYMGEVHLCRPLQDPAGTISTLKTLTTPYPPALKERLVQRFAFEAQFSIDIAHKGALHGDIAYVTGCLYRCVASLVQVIFALNQRYILNEKGSVAAIEGMPIHPDGFAATIETVLSAPGRDRSQLQTSIDRLATLVAGVKTLTHPP